MLRFRCSLLFAVALSACSAGSGGALCSRGADCASGVCNADGTCGELGVGSSSGSGAGGAASEASSSGAGEGGTTGAGGSVCPANHDGVITRAEVPLAAGLHATFRAAENATVDAAGEPHADGSRTWDLDATFAGDHDELVETLPLDGQWFAADFGGATYASRLSDTQDLLGIIEVTDDALLLRGVVSPTPGLMQTELTYQPPVTVLAFPIQNDAAWTTNASVSGQADGVYAAYLETYESKVDAHGELKTPFATFPVQRVRVDLTRAVGATVLTIHTFVFVTECFGTVATIVSQNYEPTYEFTNAAEITRLSP